MTPQRWRQIHDLFEQTSQRPAGERRQYLDDACAGDASLEAEVAGLLAHDEQAEAEEFLAAACPVNVKSQLSLPVGPEPLIGRRFGPYEIQEHVASGGMGDVYRAVRVDDYRQTVALKVIIDGLRSAELCERFRTERQVLAGLNHPNIVRLLDGGTAADGQLYFVMEYIDGQPLNRYCEQCQPALCERLRLLLAVARAIYYAHQEGVIHRDLKPGNVLVTSDGTPKINDFGLAKRLDLPATQSGAAGQTRSGVILGSPNYLAPEQAGGPPQAVGPLADVYALGAVLYELLTGRPPFQGATLLDTLEQVRSAEPISPSRLQPKLPRDLETICLKALAKNPAGRYSSAAAFAADLERFLHGLPIAARPVRSFVKAARWCRRRPAIAGLLVALALAVTVGFTCVTWQWRRAEANFAEAQRQRLRAEQSFSQAHNAVADLVQASGSDLISGKPGLDSVRLLLADEALKYYQDLLRLRGDDPLLQAEVAAAAAHAAYLYAHDPKHRHLAPDAYRMALALAQELVRKHPGDLGLGTRYASILLDFGHFHLETGNWAEAGPLLEQAVTLLDQYLTTRPDDLEIRNELARGYHSLGILYHDSGRPAEALKWHQKSRVLAAQVVRDNPTAVDSRVVLARALYHVARAQIETGHPAEALRAYEDSAALWKQLADERPQQSTFPRDLAACYHNVGNIHRDAGAFAQAESYYRRARQIREQLCRDNPDHLPFLSDAAGTEWNLGRVLERLGRRADALPAYRRSFDQTYELVEKAPSEIEYQQRLNDRYRYLARLYRDQGQPDQAAALSLHCQELKKKG
jgi:serine/threonine protein kinase